MSVIQKKSKKEIILEEAAELFKNKGFSATSMRDLAEKVGVEAASLYHHIQSKEQLLWEICQQIAAQYLQELEKAEQSDLPAPMKIKNLIAAHIRIITGDVAAASVANEEWRHLEEPLYSEFQKMRKQYEKRFAAIIEAGIQEGQLRPINPKIALYTILSSFNWLQHWYRAGRDVDNKQLESDIVGLIMGGLER